MKLTTVFVVLLATILYGQEKEGIKQQFPIHVEVTDESISLPNLWFLKYRYNPAIKVGTEYLLKEKNKHDFHLTGSLGYYYHKDWQSTFHLLPEVGYRYDLKRVRLFARLGVGYAHVFSPKTVYKFDGSEFKEAKDFGVPKLITSLSLNVSYEVTQKENSPELYFTFTNTQELPFNTYTGVHQFVGFGCKFYPFKRK